jgi:hypothetical protein
MSSVVGNVDNNEENKNDDDNNNYNNIMVAETEMEKVWYDHAGCKGTRIQTAGKMGETTRQQNRRYGGRGKNLPLIRSQKPIELPPHSSLVCKQTDRQKNTYRDKHQTYSIITVEKQHWY